MNDDVVLTQEEVKKVIANLENAKQCIEEMLSEKASLVDLLNTELRENVGAETAPQAGMKSDLRPYIRGLVDACKVTKT